jgi:putative DNA primase/helicase
LPHDPKYLFFTKIPINYARDTDCLQIKKFLRGVLDREDILVIQEWAGYLLYRMYFIKKAMIFVGEQDTGKTTLLSLLIKFIGEKNVSSISLQRMASDKFAAADLYNRYLNAYDDLSFYDLKDNGAFKMATGGGYISGEYKFGNRFPFQNYSKLTYACNQIPDVTNADDEAYFGRWILIRFNREIKRLNNNLIQEVTTPEELSGFLNFALIGLTRLLKNRKFSYDKEPEDIKKEMMLSGSSLASFAANCLMPDADGWASKDDLYEAYRQYAIAGNLTVITKENFGRKIKNYAPYIEDRKRSVFGKQMTGWGNIKLLDVESTDQPDLDDIPDLTDQGATAPEKEDGRDNTLL